jgi:hypothetical protein
MKLLQVWVAPDTTLENISFEVLSHPPYSPDFAVSAFGCLKFSYNVLKELTLHVTKMFKLLWENGFENILKVSTAGL